MDLPTEAPLVHIERDVLAQFDGLDTVHDVIAEYWSTVNSLGCCCVDATWRALFNSAVAEVAGNIVRHAYPHSASDETFNLTLQCFADRVEAIMIDHGESFEFTPPSRLPDMRASLDTVELDSGWGLPISIAATDALNYEQLPDGFNRWYIAKRKQ